MSLYKSLSTLQARVGYIVALLQTNEGPWTFLSLYKTQRIAGNDIRGIVSKEIDNESFLCIRTDYGTFWVVNMPIIRNYFTYV